MESFGDLALCAALFGSFFWLQLHPSKRQQERESRAKELHDFDWRA